MFPIWEMHSHNMDSVTIAYGTEEPELPYVIRQVYRYIMRPFRIWYSKIGGTSLTDHDNVGILKALLPYGMVPHRTC